MTPRPRRDDAILGDLVRALASTPTGSNVPNHPESPWLVGDREVTREEQNDATIRGRDLGMIDAIDMRNGFWFAAGLHGPGRECVREFGGDVGAWRAAQGGTYIDQRTWITQGDHGRAVAHSHDVEQGTGGDAAREAVEIARSVRDREDRPRFRMTPDSAPSGNLWWIEVEMLDGPTRVQARWLHQGEVGGPYEPVPGADHEVRDVTLVAARGGPTYLHKGTTFRVGVECEPDSTSIDVDVSITCVELEPGGEDRPTGRRWPHIENVAIERPRPPTVW